MDFLKKNIGLVVFIIVCLVVVGYFVSKIMAAGNSREQHKAKREELLSLMKSIKGKNLRLDEENLEKAQKVSEEARATYVGFVNKLAGKCLLPGVDFSKDPDEEDAGKEQAVDEDGNPIVKVDKFKDHPNRIRFDTWMKGTLVDARETLTNEIIKFNLKYFKSDEEDEEEDEALHNGAGGAQRNGRVAEENGGEVRKKDGAKKGGEDGAGKPAEAEKTEAEKKVISDAKAEMDAGKSTIQLEKEKRMKMIKGAEVPEYFMFGEYVTNRESGLRNNKEKRGVFRQTILLDVIIKLLQRAKVAQLDSIDFPCGLEILDGDKYTYTPVTISLTANPEHIESFLNLLNANEEYIFYLRDITSFNAEVTLNADPLLVFNQGADSGYAKLDSFLKAAGTQVESSRGGDRGGMDMDMGGGRRRRRNRDRGGNDMMDRPNRGGMMGEGADMEQKAEEILYTRKSYRVFSEAVEKEKKNQRGERGMMGEGTDGTEKNKTAEKGTTVSISLNFEFVEFKPIAE